MDTLKYQLADKITPTTGIPEWYFGVLLLAAVVIILGWKWIESKKPVQEERRADVREGDSVEIRALERIITTQITALKEVIEEKMRSMESRVEDRLEEFKTSLDENEKREEGRMGELRTKMEAGFRAVHARIDSHVDGSGAHTKQARGEDGTDKN